MKSPGRMTGAAEGREVWDHDPAQSAGANSPEIDAFLPGKTKSPES